MIPQLLCIFSGFFLFFFFFFLLLGKMCKTVAGQGSNLRIVFLSSCFCHLLKSSLFPPHSLLSRVLVTSTIAQCPPPSTAETAVCCCHCGAKSRTSGAKKETPKLPVSGSKLFPISSLSPQRALPFQPSPELLGVRLQAPGKTHVSHYVPKVFAESWWQEILQNSTRWKGAMGRGRTCWLEGQIHRREPRY